MKRTIYQTIFLSIALLIGIISAAKAATYTVTNTSDSGTGSLRAAFALANATTADDTINFDTTGVFAAAQTITLTGGQLTTAASSGDLTINGTGANRLIISANQQSRVFFFDDTQVYSSNSNVFLDALTIADGSSQNSVGGAILSYRILTITNSIISSSNAVNNGGGIYFANDGTLINSVVRGNYTSMNGGGIYCTRILTLTNSTLSGNRASGYGGGLYLPGSRSAITNSTISSNRATYGGGISGDGISPSYNSIFSSTISNNQADADGGGSLVLIGGGGWFFQNTIIASNITPGIAPDIYGQFTSHGYNLVGSANGITQYVGDQTGNIYNISPKLAPLADNGGATQTQALLAGSPAIDKGSSTLTTDQRGFARPVDNTMISNASGGNGSDIGAFEAQLAPTAATVSISGRLLTLSGRGISGVRLTLTDSNGQVRTVTSTAFGYYIFEDVEAGSTYILSVTGKHYTFSQPTQVLNIIEESNEINFVADSEKRLRGF